MLNGKPRALKIIYHGNDVYTVWADSMLAPENNVADSVVKEVVNTDNPKRRLIHYSYRVSPYTTLLQVTTRTVEANERTEEIWSTGLEGKVNFFEVKPVVVIPYTITNPMEFLGRYIELGYHDYVNLTQYG